MPVRRVRLVASMIAPASSRACFTVSPVSAPRLHVHVHHSTYPTPTTTPRRKRPSNGKARHPLVTYAPEYCGQ
jgi:hypothetical protein